MTSMRHYETTIIINGALEEDNINQVVARTTEFIARNGGEIKSADHWGRRRLAYVINKKNNGYYVQFQVDSMGELIPLLDRFYQLEEHIIRHLTLQLDDHDLKSRDEMRQKMLAESEAEEANAKGAGEEATPEVSTKG